MNLIITCFSLFLSIFNPFTSLIEDVDETNEYVIEYSNDNNTSIINHEYFNSDRNGNIDLYQNSKFICSINSSYIVYDDYVTTTEIINNYIMINKYLFNGESEQYNLNIYVDSTLLNNTLLIRNNDVYYLLIEYDNDIYIYKININNEVILIKHLIGEGIEKIEKALMLDNKLFIALSKDNLSSGDYGNGGVNNQRNIVVISLDDNLELLNRISFESEEINSFEVKNNNLLSIGLNNAFFLYDSDLNQKIGLKFASNCISNKTMINELGIYYLTRFLKNGLEVYNLNTKELVYQEGFSNNNNIINIDKIIERNDNYYGINENNKIINIIKVYYIEGFIDNNVYYDNSDKPSNINNYIYSLNKKIERTSFKTIGEFDSNKTGTFITYYFYDDLELIGKTINYPYINVRDGLIYNIGYKLESNMEMYLNDKAISNNYELDNNGEYNIKYYIDGVLEKEVDIKIDDEMFNIGSNRYYLNEFDYYLMVNENIRLEYNIELEENESIDSIIVNNSIIKDFDTFEIDDKTIGLFVYFVAKEKGINEYTISYIKIKSNNNDIYRLINVNKKYYLYGMNDEIEYDINVNVGKSIVLESNINDSDFVLRGIYIDYYKDNNFIFRDIHIIGNNELSLNNNLGCNNIKVGYICDINYSTLVTEPLFEAKYSSISDKEKIRFNIVCKEEVIKKIEITIYETNKLLNVYIDGNNAYRGNNYDYGLIIGLSLCIVGLSIGYSIFIIRKNKKSNNK